MKKYPHFFIRTVRNGKIRFDKRLWEPQEPTERLDGKRFAFGTYPSADGIKDLLCLWGSEAAYREIGTTCDNEELIDKHWENDYELLAPDGFFRQYWWELVKSQ